MAKKPYSHIIWDWNGTLLDDIDLCVKTINDLLVKRHLPGISQEEYLETFEFPVSTYYQKIGFSFELEPFSEISKEFITAYEKGRRGCQLMPGARETLEVLSSNGYTQSILSASKQTYLNQAVIDYGINHHFSSINGLDNYHAAGKSGIARQFMDTQKLAPEDILLIGDTKHDAEIARLLGIDCWLIPNGHQSYQRLAESNVPLVESLLSTIALIG
ncbi:MAG: HAD hydrolase-like protein [Anaerolineales bacterium]